jgi:hypothetical protein
MRLESVGLWILTAVSVVRLEPVELLKLQVGLVVRQVATVEPLRLTAVTRTVTV